MRRIRIGNDIQVSWEVKTGGESISLEGRQLKLYVKSGYQKQEIKDFVVEGCTISFTYLASMQRSTGARAIILNDATKGSPEKTICADQAFTLVAHSCEENDDDVDFEDYLISLQSNILIGRPGMSAYDLWLQDGHTGTVEDYYAWLQKPASDFVASVSAAEQQRVEAEKERVKAEVVRTKTEIEREANELTRKNNETERKNTEAHRAKSENNREAAERRREADVAKLKQDVEDKTSIAIARCTKAAERAESISVAVDGTDLVITINDVEG